MPELADAIDHIVIGTPNLEATREELIDLGFQITPHGVHEKFGTDNYLFVLEDSYVELFGVSGRPAEVRTSLEVLEPCVALGGGVPMLALAANNMDAAHTRLQALGVDATAPLFWSRPADTPDGPRTASVTTMFVNSPMLPGLTTFYCKHHTVEFVRHRAWREHRNDVQTLQRLIFAPARSSFRQSKPQARMAVRKPVAAESSFGSVCIFCSICRGPTRRQSCTSVDFRTAAPANDSSSTA